MNLYGLFHTLSNFQLKKLLNLTLTKVYWPVYQKKGLASLFLNYSNYHLLIVGRRKAPFQNEKECKWIGVFIYGENSEIVINEIK